jgi:hypothetical protein
MAGVGVVYSPYASRTTGSMNGQQIKALTSWHEFCTFIGHEKYIQRYVRSMWNVFVTEGLRPRNRHAKRKDYPGESEEYHSSEDD